MPAHTCIQSLTRTPQDSQARSTLSTRTAQKKKKMSLEGKVAVVTGAAAGIGKALSEILFKNGAKVVLLDVNESAGKSLMEALNKEKGQDSALFLSCDVQLEEQLKGIKPLLSCPVYSATKSGVIGFTRAMAGASTMAGFGIRFNALCPALVKTELLAHLTEKLGQFTILEEPTRQLLDKYGVLSPSDVAECLLELVTDESKNGEAYMVCPIGNMYATFPSIEPEAK
ncbi:15-hydroxyprostaglandin dehydrogenase [NAD(+)] isoform X2 [Syngnathoides biaculeatus]|uniref:15-hydroxyprostaglandin dehydrogenase [NAD(+)] isoform X2 n=1 Tax=Syngnathoides biaculeatus TaxID=300417 RepID=UPI002ADD72A5|nr:15-hydroxyprostaglandin dehydrogenase [NAD(+)] isoform X2 [Syngnathoides biaculeatus]